MSEELTTTGGVPASPETPAAPAIQAPEQALAPEVKALIDAAVSRVKDEYEKVHIPALKSKLDKRIAKLTQQADVGRQARIQQAEALESQGDAEGALKLLKGAVAESYSQQETETRVGQARDWAMTMLEEFGLDADKDEEVQGVLEQLDPLDPNFGYAFYHETGKLLKARADKASKEAKAVLGTVPDIVKAEVKKALAAGGLEPDLGTPQGAGPNDDLMKLPPTRRIAEILRRERQQGKS